MNLKLQLLFCAILSSALAFGQGKGSEQLSIRTTAVCDMCVKTIEENLIYEKGVRAVSVDLATNLIHVEYLSKKTDPESIRKAVSKLGYSADDLPGDPVAFKKLPDCCQMEGCGQPKGSKAPEHLE